jgi:hypothetical protein
VDRHNKTFQNFRSIAGAAFMGLGVLILFRNLTTAVSQVSHLFGITADAADNLGVLTAGVLAASNASQAYLFDHGEFLRSVHLILLSFWPLFFVIAGTLLLWAGIRGATEKIQKKRIQDMSISLPLVRRINRAGISGRSGAARTLSLI